MTRTTRPFLLFATILALPITGCSARVDEPTSPRRVVLITLDTTRADRLSAYGLMDVSMPHLDRLAREGVVFDQATTVAPLTLPAHGSLLTGLLPPAHGLRDNAGPPLAAAHDTLAEVLHARGFRTAAFVGSVILDRDRGLDQGFDHYSDVRDTGEPGADSAQRSAEAVVTDALSWLAGLDDSPFFLWVHLYDPHRPYAPPEPFASRHADPYIGEIAYADSQIGRLLAELDRQQLLDRSIVVVAGDHGESLGDHGERDHGIFIYESVLRVPLIIRAPSIPPRRVASVVRLTDVMPTILDLVGVAPPRPHGVSLALLMQGGEQELEAYSESLYPRQFGWSALRALRDGRFKLIDAPRPELYDLERDPWEEHNIHHERPTLAAALKQRLTALSGMRSATPNGARNERPVSPELRERLAALGYVSAGVSSAAIDDVGAPDPKDCIDIYNKRRGDKLETGATPLPTCTAVLQRP